MGFVLPGQNGSNFGMAPGSTGGGAAPSAPLIISPLTASGTQGTAFNYFITATGSPTSYNANVPPPAGLTVNTATGHISGTPTTAAITNVTISATNALGTDSQTLVVTIAVARPVVTAGTLSGVAGTAITPFQIAATNSPTSYAVNPALPAGLSLNTTTGEITGTPAATINTSVQMTATNAGGTSNLATLTINIAATLPAPPVITPGQSISGTAGSAITAYPVQNTGGTATNWSATGLPTNLTINASTGVISGTPTTATGSPFTANITAINAGGSSGPVPLTVNVAPAAVQVPVVTSSATPRGVELSPFTYQITATNGPLTGYRATNLPAYLSQPPQTGPDAGKIMGTLPAAPATATFQVFASNATGESAAFSVTLTVAGGWEVTYPFPNHTVFDFGLNGKIPLANMVGWQSAFAADMTNDLYFNAAFTSMATLPVNLFATYPLQPEVLVQFDRWPGTNAPNKITDWGYDDSDKTIYITGSNGTGGQIQLRLVKT